MTWDAIGAIGEIIAALGVVVSLFYVASQVRANTRQSKLTSSAVMVSNSQAMKDAHNQVRLLIADNPDLARIWLKGQEAPDSLSDEERFRFRLLMGAGVSNAQFIFGQVKHGVNDQFESSRNIDERMLSTPGGKWFWKNYSGDYDAEFRKDIGKRLNIEGDHSDGT